MIANKIADKIANASKKSNKELSNNDEAKEDVEITTLYHQKKDNKLLMN